MTIIVVVEPDKILNTAQLIVMVQSPDGLVLKSLRYIDSAFNWAQLPNIVLSVRYANIM